MTSFAKTIIKHKLIVLLVLFLNIGVATAAVQVIKNNTAKISVEMQDLPEYKELVSGEIVEQKFVIENPNRCTGVLFPRYIRQNEDKDTTIIVTSRAFPFTNEIKQNLIRIVQTPIELSEGEWMYQIIGQYSCGALSKTIMFQGPEIKVNVMKRSDI